MQPLDIDNTDDDINTSAALMTMTNNANALKMAKFEIAEGVRFFIFIFIFIFIFLKSPGIRFCFFRCQDLSFFCVRCF